MNGGRALLEPWGLCGVGLLWDVKLSQELGLPNSAAFASTLPFLD